VTTFLGIDAGGTRTTVLLARDTTILARVSGGPGAVRPGRALATAARIAATARHALTEGGVLAADVLVIGAAGAGRDPERSELRDGLRHERLAERVMVLGDLEIALEAAFGSGPGIVLISGTGSVAVGRTADGRIHRRGGYGWQIGDEGGGFAISRAALGAVARAHDGRSPETGLGKALLAAAPVKEFDPLIRWTVSADPSEIAALAPVVFQVAAQGDPVAQQIVNAAAEDLAQLASSLLGVFGPKKQVPLALSGGNLAANRGLRGPLLEQLKKQTRFVVRQEEIVPAEGALGIARRLAAG
jgi:glucosamine kinase